MSYKKIALFILIACSVLPAFSQTNIRKWRKTEQDSMQRALILYEEGLYAQVLPIYENLYNQHPKEEYLKYCFGRCALYRSDKQELAYQLLNEIYAKNKKVADIEYDLARASHFNYKFDEAIALIDKAFLNKRTSPDAKKNLKQLREYCNNAKAFYNTPTDAKIDNLNSVINTVYDEYVPVISADESIMIYTYRGVNSMGGLQNQFVQPDPYGAYYEDVYQSTKDGDGIWKEPTPITPINTISHDAAIGLSADGQKLFVYRDNGDDHGDIYMSINNDTAWSTPQKLRGEINSYSWEGSCSMTADGKQIYFSSERFGGKGGKDIYRATLQPDSTWAQVVNLGDSINTTLDDDAPFIHPDGITLFYSSKGKNSMGGYDIFQSKLNWKDSIFSNPINLGYPINTTDEDIYYVLSADGNHGYYASGKKGGKGLKDIYTVYPGYVGKKPTAYIVKGKVTHNDTTALAIPINVVITDNNNKKLGDFSSNAKNGTYLISLPADASFKLTFNYLTFPAKEIEINTMNLNGYNEKIANINFTAKDTIKKDTTQLVMLDPSVKKMDGMKEIPIKKDLFPDTFVPKTAEQKENKFFNKAYGDISAEGLQFRVQIAAYKKPRNFNHTHLKKFGKIEKIKLNDGVTRITLGGAFKTLNKAYILLKRVSASGQKDAFVTAIYKGKRVLLSQLIEEGIYPKQ